MEFLWVPYEVSCSFSCTLTSTTNCQFTVKIFYSLLILVLLCHAESDHIHNCILDAFSNFNKWFKANTLPLNFDKRHFVLVFISLQFDNNLGQKKHTAYVITKLVSSHQTALFLVILFKGTKYINLFSKSNYLYHSVSQNVDKMSEDGSII
jgi:hypothetical protein